MSLSKKLLVLALLGSAAPAAAYAQSASVSEVVVTAQKREEKLVNVPISVVAITGANLSNSGVTGVNSLGAVVPGLHIDQSGAFEEPSIRGVGTEISGPGSNPNIPIYVDGIVRPAMLGDDFNFIDVDSIQVLKGPQGTFFGRNATGGAILVTTRAPSFTPQLDVKASYGSFGTENVGLFASGPIWGDKLAGSVAGGYTHSDGWIHDDTTGRQADRSDTYTARGKLLFEPTTWAKFTLIGDIGRQSDPTAYAASAYHGLSAGAAAGFPVITTDTHHINLDAFLAHVEEQEGYELKSEFDLGFAKLTSYTAGRYLHGYEFLDIDGSGGALAAGGWHETEHTFSQEFDLGHSGGALDWVTGLYYYHDNDGQRDPGFEFSAGGAPYVQLFNDFQISESYSFFGDATYNWDKWHFTLGGRLSRDTAVAQYTFVPTATVTRSALASFDTFTPRVVVRYSLTPDSNVYVSFSQGTKPGLYNAAGLNGVGQLTPLKGEKLTDWEGGYKVSKHNWSLEASAFHYDYRNLQIQIVTDTLSSLESVPESEMYGFDFNFQQRLADGLHLTFGGAYTHARYTDFKCNTPNPPPTEACGGATYTPNPANPHLIVATGQVNLDGYQMERTPEFSGNIGLDYTHSLFGGTMELNGNYNYETRIYFDANEGATQGAFGVLNLRAAWTDPSKHLTVSLSGNNVTDQVYLTQVLEQQSVFSQTFGAPASVMGQIEYKY